MDFALPASLSNDAVLLRVLDGVRHVYLWHSQPIFEAAVSWCIYLESELVTLVLIRKAGNNYRGDGSVIEGKTGNENEG